MSGGDIAGIVIASVFFAVLCFPPAIFLLSLQVDKTFSGVVVIYQKSCPVCAKLLSDHENTDGVVFLCVSSVPRSAVSIADAKSQLETFHTGGRVTVGTSASKHAADYVLSLVNTYGFDMRVPFCVRVHNSRPDTDSAVTGYPNSILAPP